MSAAILMRAGARSTRRGWLGARLLCAVARWRAERLAAEQLHAMNDHLLADLGIERMQIDALVRGKARR